LLSAFDRQSVINCIHIQNDEAQLAGWNQIERMEPNCVDIEGLGVGFLRVTHRFHGPVWSGKWTFFSDFPERAMVVLEVVHSHLTLKEWEASAIDRRGFFFVSIAS
jgi:hypothetical protein